MRQTFEFASAKEKERFMQELVQGFGGHLIGGENTKSLSSHLIKNIPIRKESLYATEGSLLRVVEGNEGDMFLVAIET